MKELTSEEHQALLRSVGTHRGDRVLSPLEVGRLLTKAIATGTTRKECADSLHLGQTQVANFIKLLSLAQDIQHLADWGSSTDASISFSSLAEIARLREPDQIEATNAILQHQLTWKEVRQLVQLADRSKKAMGQCIDEVLRLRPQLEIRHLFVGAVTAKSLRQYLSTLLQRERNKLMESAMETLLGHEGLVSGRLGAHNFTILSSQDLSTLVGLEPDEIEGTVNEAIERVKTGR